MIPAKPLDRAISNIKYRLGKYYVRMGLIPLPPKLRVCRVFSYPSPPRGPYVINDWPPMSRLLLQPQSVCFYRALNRVTVIFLEITQ